MRKRPATTMVLTGASIALSAALCPAAAQAAPAKPACAWHAAETVKIGGVGWVRLNVNGCGSAYMQSWWPPTRVFECSIYSETAKRYLEFTVKAYGCTSNIVNVGSDSIYAAAFVTDINGGFDGSANTGFHRAN